MLYEDGEVIGWSANHTIIQWDGDNKHPYDCCETLEEFGEHNLTPTERVRLGLPPEVTEPKQRA